MKASEQFQKISNWAETHPGLIALVGVIVLAIGEFGPWALTKLTLFVTVAPTFLVIAGQYSEMGVRYGIILIIIGVFVGIRTLNSRLKNLERQTVILLNKSTCAKLTNWDYQGQWSLDGESLSVTDSDDGGLWKSGVAWEDYDFRFDFKIVNQYGAWIVRAQSLHKYVMIQCNVKNIRPHIRTFNEPESKEAPPDPERGFKVLGDYPHLIPWTEWNNVKTEVRGYGIRVFINEHLAYEDPNVLKEFPLGRVGFRCSGPEHALFKKH